MRTRTTLGEILPISYGKARAENYGVARQETPVYGSSGQIGAFDRALTKGPALIVGRKGSAGSVYYTAEPCWPIDTVYFAEGNDRTHLPYFRYFLESLSLGRLDRSTAIPSLSRDDYNSIEVEIPSFDEQRRIVAKIEEQFSRLDSGVAALSRVQTQIKSYRAAVLAAACSGRLVPTEAELAYAEGRAYENGAQLLARILVEHRARWTGRGKYKAPSGPGAADLYQLPTGWVWATLGQLAWSVKDGPHYSPKYTPVGVPFISGGNVRPEGIDFSETKFISPELHVELSKRCKPEYGDMLYTKGGTTGIARVNTENRDFNVWVHVAVLKLVEPLHKFYLQHALNSPHCYRQAQKHTHGVGNQDLGLTRMVWITVPLPPLAEQHRIVAEVDRRLSLVGDVEQQIKADVARADRFRQAVLTLAFSGTPSQTALRE